MEIALAVGIVASFVIAWAVYLLMPEKGGSIWVRFGAICCGLMFLLGVWELGGWVWHVLSKLK